MMIRRCTLAALCFLTAHLPDRNAARGEEPTGPWNLRLATLGGKQFWADQTVFHGWRIQRNALTGHFRLIDKTNERHAWGSFEHCQGRLNQIREEQDLPPVRGKAVIVLHGLFRTRGAMEGLAQHLNDEGDYTALTFGYPTTRGSIEDHAADLAHVIEQLPEVEEINFVAHSLGNLVVRRYLADSAAAGRKPDARIKRIVMLAPPNLRAEMAEILVPLDISGQVAGRAGAQLARELKEFSPKLGRPSCEFGILAGGRSDGKGYNPLLPGDDDLVVTVASTRLPGAADFRVLPVIHTTMMNDPQVRKFTLKFLQDGCFESDELRQPIAIEKTEP